MEEKKLKALREAVRVVAGHLAMPAAKTRDYREGETGNLNTEEDYELTDAEPWDKSPECDRHAEPKKRA